MAAEPGERFEYSNGVSYLLSVILQRATGTTSLEFAREHLFGPLGITDVVWPSSPQGVNIGWGQMEMKPLAMAKIGYLVLQQGQWQGKRIVSKAWLEESTRRHIGGTLAEGYGYHWWIDEHGTIMALGYAGQYIGILREHDLVVVFTSELPEEEFYAPKGILYSHIVPAVRDD
jgi:CubicO group peptidase (beta-lactamase class C family)